MEGAQSRLYPVMGGKSSRFWTVIEIALTGLSAFGGRPIVRGPREQCDIRLAVICIGIGTR
ncbi:protein of unknown function [Candidatus Filomicrobium marinum]|uniref:Uncharacterized protein n=1 Tax=Candidatus Filomicrobium marinum TaxID=1608628 RepID=A0A0D6JI35_9HYPH|nr:protein of unknown function [Candidatus Filomicrobium marinum]CPR21512.1 protein of unknown function [Candidatus Filomicrobium marinum]